MITCTVRYEIDPDKLAEFEIYAKAWLYLVPKLGGVHHGYHMPHEGPNDIAYCHFSFPTLAAYEVYREKMWADAECQRAYAHAQITQCIRRYDRSFTKPLFEGATVDTLGL
ncbi:MAG: NIPSNAP family protein [Litoreibacter sp.]